MESSWARPHATQEQSLWETFRGHCDAIFQKRQRAHADYTAGLQANKARAAMLCEELEQLARRSGAALRDDAAKIAGWRSAFETLGELPRGEERALRARFERAQEGVQSALARQRVQEKEQSIADLLEAARRIHAYASAVAQAEPASELDSLRRAAETFIAGVLRFPKGATEALTAAWASADTAACSDPGPGADAAARETVLRMLCIRGEILNDRPTPPEDQPLRREHQMRRLVEHMGQRSEKAVEDFETLVLEWVRAQPAEPRIYGSLLERFRRLHSPTG